MNQQEDPALLPNRIETEAASRMAARQRSALIAVSSLCFILLQSACTAVMAISGLRLLIGAGSLAFAATGLKFLDSVHADAIRIPMMIVAGVGSVINLYVIWRIRSLRLRASSSWRATPISPGKRRAENFQVALAVLTLLLIAAECVAHRHLFGVFYGSR